MGRDKEPYPSFHYSPPSIPLVFHAPISNFEAGQGLERVGTFEHVGLVILQPVGPFWETSGFSDSLWFLVQMNEINYYNKCWHQSTAFKNLHSFKAITQEKGHNSKHWHFYETWFDSVGQWLVAKQRNHKDRARITYKPRLHAVVQLRRCRFSGCG